MHFTRRNIVGGAAAAAGALALGAPPLLARAAQGPVLQSLVVSRNYANSGLLRRAAVLQFEVHVAQADSARTWYETVEPLLEAGGGILGLTTGIEAFCLMHLAGAAARWSLLSDRRAHQIAADLDLVAVDRVRNASIQSIAGLTFAGEPAFWTMQTRTTLKKSSRTEVPS